MSEILHIYTRVSTTAQEQDGTSLDTQRELGIKKAKDLGFKYKVWNEGGQSSAKDDFVNRPVLLGLLQQVEIGSVKHLFVFNTDRLSRNEETWGVIRIKLVKNEVAVYTSSGQFNLNNPMDKLLLGIMSAVSTYDNSIRAERSRLGKVERVKQGFWLGGPPPFGYKLINKKLVPEPTEKKWVKYIFESYRDRKSVREIREHLMLNGVITRRGNVVWSFGSIEKLLTNTHYSGYYVVTDKKSGEVIRVDCEPLLTNSLVSDAIKEREKRSKIRVSESNIKRFYLLREFLVCKHCGSYFSGKTQSDTSRSVYYCPRKERNFVNKRTERYQECQNSRYLKIADTDNLVWSVVVEVLSNSAQFKDEVKKQVFEETPKYNQQQLEVNKLKKLLKKHEEELKGIKQSLINLHTDIYINKSDSLDTKKVISNVEQYRIELEGKIEELNEKIVQFETQKKWVNWISEFGKRIDKFGEFTPEERKQLLKNVIAKIEVETVDKQTHKLNIHFNLPYVDDKFEWVNKSKKSLGYRIYDGKKVKEVELLKLKKY